MSIQTERSWLSTYGICAKKLQQIGMCVYNVPKNFILTGNFIITNVNFKSTKQV